MPRWLFGWIGRLRARDIVGNVVVGGNSGIVYQVSGAGPPPAPPTLPWAEALPEAGSPFEIFNLLSWKSRLVRELRGRETEKRSLLEWARTGPRLRIRFLVGPGGAGKTRLAAEIAEALTGWRAGFAALERATTLPLSRSGLFIILDYPEAWPKEVESLLREAARIAPPPAPIRLLLLSRRPMSEWSRVIDDCGATTLCDAQEVGISVLPPGTALSLFRDAATRLAAHRRLAAPVVDETGFIAWLRQAPELHALPLFMTAAAIHLVDEPANTLGLRAGEIVGALLERERKRLDAAGAAVGFRASTPASLGGGSRLVGLAALRDGLDAAALRRLAAPELEIGLPAPTQIVDAARAARLTQADRVFAPAPDIVAAELLRQVIADAGDRGAAWVWETLRDPGSLQVELIDRRLHDIVTLRGPAERGLQNCMVAAVTGRPERAQTWRKLSDSIERSFRLSPISVAVGRCLLQEVRPDSERRADVLTNLSVHLSDAGENVGALAAIREAVEIYRPLAQENAARFAPDLATSLNNLSNGLSDAGDNAGALAAIREAVEIRRRLAQENAARFAPDLALSLNNLSVRLSDAGDNAGALAAIREAVEIRRRLGQENAARFTPDLALSLNNLSNRLSDAGDNAGALAAIHEAAEIYRRLAQENAARFAPDLAMSLNNLSNALSDAGDNAGALAAIREAVEIRRRLAQENAARFAPDLALSLNNLSNRLSDAGDNAGALAAIREAVETYRRLAQENAARFAPDLAQSLNNLSVRLSDAGDNAGALTAIREAVEIRRRLAQENAARFAPDLAQSLNNLSNRLSDAGDNAGALTAIREAVEIRRRLAQENAARFAPDLATSLNNLSNRLSDAGDNAGALVAIREAVEIRRRLAQENATRYGAALERSLTVMRRLERSGV